jgi:hypothetical protein
MRVLEYQVQTTDPRESLLSGPIMFRFRIPQDTI